jgi:hypothetical protein
MTSINLNDYITDDVSIIEVFFCKDDAQKNGSGTGADTEAINVKITSDIESIIEKKYKKYKGEKYKSYHHKDKVYTYELTSDNQYVFSKIMTKSKYEKYNNKNSLYILTSKIDKFPQYIFPCTNEIENISTYTINEYKIANRVSLMIRYDYENNVEVAKTFYIEYRHSPNVEIDKINEHVNNLVNTFVAYI